MWFLIHLHVLHSSCFQAFVIRVFAVSFVYHLRWRFPKVTDIVGYALYNIISLASTLTCLLSIIIVLGPLNKPCSSKELSASYPANLGSYEVVNRPIGHFRQLTDPSVIFDNILGVIMSFMDSWHLSFDLNAMIELQLKIPFFSSPPGHRCHYHHEVVFVVMYCTQYQRVT